MRTTMEANQARKWDALLRWQMKKNPLPREELWKMWSLFPFHSCYCLLPSNPWLTYNLPLTRWVFLKWPKTLKGFERKLLDIDILKVGHHKEKFLWNGRTFLVLYAYIGILDVWSLWCKNEGFQFKGIKIKILKNIQGITIQKRKRNYFFSFIKGWWSWHLLIVRYLCLIGGFLHVRSKLYDQETDSQVDYGCVNILLLNLHRRPILPGILHLNPRGNYLGTWGRSHVECQVYLSVSG